MTQSDCIRRWRKKTKLKKVEMWLPLETVAVLAEIKDAGDLRGRGQAVTALAQQYAERSKGAA